MRPRVYPVGPPGSGEEFESIQAAIDQAVLDGATPTERGLLRVAPGIYVEDLSLAANVDVVGTASAVVHGTVEVDLADQGDDVDLTLTTWRQVSIAAQAAGAPGVRFTGSVPQQARFIEALIEAVDGDAVVVENTGVDGDGNDSFLPLVQSNLTSLAPGRAVVRQSAGFVFMALGQLEADSSGVALETTGGFTVARVMNFIGRLSLGGGFAQLLRSNVENLGSSPIEIAGGSSATLEGLTVINTDTSPAITGTGILLRDWLSYTNSGDGVDATLASDIVRPIDQASNLLYVPASPGDWAVIPSRVNDALDRLVSVVAVLNGGPV